MNLKDKTIEKVNKHLLKKYFTILLVPHSSEKSIQLNITMWFIYISVAVFLFIISIAGFILSRQIDYGATLIAEKTLKDKVELFSKQLIETQAYIENVKDIEIKIKELLGLKSKQAIIESEGVGGPTRIESYNIDRYLKNDYKMSEAEFSINLDMVNKKLNERVKEWTKIREFISEQKCIYKAIPSLIPTYGRITSYFGQRMHPMTGEGEYHQGIDIACYRGTPIRATSSGIVTFSNWAGGYGKLVVINHGYGYSTRYAHLQRIKVKLLQKIRKGDVIGYVGSTGTSTGDHLHYEVRINEKIVNPIKYLRKPKI